MFLVELMAVAKDSMLAVFDEQYPEEDFRNLHVDLEYPMKSDQYPGLWVDYVPLSNPKNTGIANLITENEPEVGWFRHRLWDFGGKITYTVATLSSLERARLHDEVLKTIAFGIEDDRRKPFFDQLLDNQYLAIVPIIDSVEVTGWSSSRGTPWNTEDMIYEVTLGIQIYGEFASAGESQTLVDLREIQIIPIPEGQPDPRPDLP